MKTNKKKQSLLVLLLNKISIDNISTSNWMFFIFILFLGFLVIFSSHSLNDKTLKVNKLYNEIIELNSRFTQMNIKLMKICLDSELMKEVEKKSLISLEANKPYKIVIVSKKYDY